MIRAQNSRNLSFSAIVIILNSYIFRNIIFAYFNYAAMKNRKKKNEIDRRVGEHKVSFLITTDVCVCVCMCVLLCRRTSINRWGTSNTNRTKENNVRHVVYLAIGKHNFYVLLTRMSRFEFRDYQQC